MGESADPSQDTLIAPRGRAASTVGPIAVVLALVLAGLSTFALVTVPPAAEGSSAAFVSSSGYFVWRLLIVFLMLASLIGAVVAGPMFLELRRRYRSANLASLALAYALGLVIVVGLHLLAWRNMSLTWNMLNARIAVLLVLVAVASIPPVGLIWLVRDRVHRLAGEDRPAVTDPVDRRIEELLALRRTSITALGILAGVISLTVVVTGQLRLAQIAVGAPPEKWPIAAVILYGAFFAAILGLLYVPLYLKWRDNAEALRVQLYPIPADGRPDAAWSEGRRRLSDLLTLDTGLVGSLGPILSVLSPFLISILGYFLPKA